MTSTSPTTSTEPAPDAASAPSAPISPALLRTGSLWGHSRLRLLPPRWLIVSLCLAIMSGYGLALGVNSEAARFMTSRFELARDAGDPLLWNSGLGFVVLVLDPMFLLCTFRALAAAALTAVLYARGDFPSTLPPLNGTLLIPFLIGLTNAGGYLCYLTLTARDGVVIWSAMVGLYVVLPVCYGILFKEEARTPKKLLGIGACVLASLLLGLQESSVELSLNESVPWWSNAILYLLCIVMWGICDTLAAFVGRQLHTSLVAGITGLGFGTAGLLCALASYVISAAAPLSPTLRDSASSAGGYLLLAFAQCAGIGAWFASVKLGVYSEASAFLPIVSLYTILTSLFAAIIMREPTGPLYWVGVVVAAVGISLISFSDYSCGSQTRGKREGPMAASAAADVSLETVEGAAVEDWAEPGQPSPPQ
jgi:drug/metabolite transporter (DMT)-like permease